MYTLELGCDLDLSQEQFKDWGMRRAKTMCKDFKLAEALGITSHSDLDIFERSLALRIIRTKIYDLNFALHSPEYRFGDPKSIENTLEKYQLAQEDLSDALTKRRKYSSEETSMRYRTLELAANALIATATQSPSDSDPLNTRIVLTESLVKDWGQRWATELGLHPGRRQVRTRRISAEALKSSLFGCRTSPF